MVNRPTRYCRGRACAYNGLSKTKTWTISVETSYRAHLRSARQAAQDKQTAFQITVMLRPGKYEDRMSLYRTILLTSLGIGRPWTAVVCYARSAVSSRQRGQPSLQHPALPHICPCPALPGAVPVLARASARSCALAACGLHPRRAVRGSSQCRGGTLSHYGCTSRSLRNI